MGVRSKLALIESRDGRAARVVVLSDGLWKRRFNSDIVGATVRINGEGHEGIGVMPPDFVFPAGTQFRAPLAAARPHINPVTALRAD